MSDLITTSYESSKEHNTPYLSEATINLILCLYVWLRPHSGALLYSAQRLRKRWYLLGYCMPKAGNGLFPFQMTLPLRKL